MKKLLSLTSTILATLLIAESASAGTVLLTSDTVLSNFGLQNLELSYKVADHLSLGLAGYSTSRGIRNHDILLNGNAVGVIARYYKEEAFQDDTWYGTASYIKTNYEARITSNGTDYLGKSDDLISVGAGYHWFWKSFNIALGGVLQTPSTIELKDSAGNKYQDDFNTNVGIELKIGGMF